MMNGSSSNGFCRVLATSLSNKCNFWDAPRALRKFRCFCDKTIGSVFLSSATNSARNREAESSAEAVGGASGYRGRGIIVCPSWAWNRRLVSASLQTSDWRKNRDRFVPF